MEVTPLRAAYHGVLDALDVARQVSDEVARPPGSGVEARPMGKLLSRLDATVAGTLDAVAQLRTGSEHAARPLAAGRASLDAARAASRQLMSGAPSWRPGAAPAKAVVDHLDDAARSLRAVNVAEAHRPVALDLPDRWVWDTWFVDDGSRHHMFFLNAPKSLGDPELRHHNARIGHAVSDDMKTWTEVAPALTPSATPGDWDDLAVWTGSTVRAPDGSWRMFYTAVNRAEGAHVQRIGMASSDDLITWTKHPGPILEADGRHYEKLGDSAWEDEAWRDPHVFEDPNGDGYHMYVTARAKTGEMNQRGVVGHATSPDMTSWTAREPLSTPGQGFGEYEVLSNVRPASGDEVLFSTYARKQDRGDIGASSGLHTAPINAQLGDYAMDRSQLVAPPDMYAGQIVKDRDGTLNVFAFLDEHGDAPFGGKVVGPIPYEP